MSYIKHTPEPWFVRSQGWDGQFIYGYDSRVLPKTEPRFIAEVSLMYDGAEANAARIVSCVNACKGMSDPTIEIQSIRQQLADTQRKLEAAERDAGRYRFIRDTPWSDPLQRIIAMHKNAVWDEGIDRAIEQSKGDQS